MPARTARLLGTLARFRHVLGRRGSAWLALTFASSLALAVVEYALVGFLQLFLVSLGYIDPSQIPSVLAPLADLGTTGLCAALVAIGLARSLALFMSTYCSDGTQETVAYRYKQATIHEMLLRRGRRFLPASEVHFRTGELIPKSQLFVSSANSLLLSAIQVGSLSVGMIAFAWRETLVGMAGLSVAGVLVLLSNRVVVRNARLVPPIQAQISKGIERVSRNWLFVRISRTQRLEHARLLERVFRYFDVNMRVSFFNNLMVGLPPLFGICLFAAIIYASRSLFHTPASTLVSVLYLFLRLVQHLGNGAFSVGQATKNWPQFSQAIDLFMRVSPEERREALEARPGHAPPEARPADEALTRQAPGIRVEAASFAWGPELPPVLNALSWSVPSGGIAGIVGPSGAGKSTLLLMILGILEPTQGSVRVGGLEPARYFEGIGDRLGYVGAEPFLMDGSLQENLEYGLARKPSDAELWKALEQAHLAHTARELGLEHRLDENGTGLSTGQKQRLALARALLRQPRILVLDEATANLDNATEMEIAGTIRGLAGSTTVLIVSHRPGILEACSEVLRLG